MDYGNRKKLERASRKKICPVKRLGPRALSEGTISS
jgi:hypothetical protein